MQFYCMTNVFIQNIFFRIEILKECVCVGGGINHFFSSVTTVILSHF